MGKLARLVDGIKEKLAGGGKAGKAVCYDKVDKTESMRVEIRSRRARQLIAENLAAADVRLTPARLAALDAAVPA